MNPSRLLLLAAKGAVPALDRATGARVWQTTPSSAWTGGLRHRDPAPAG